MKRLNNEHPILIADLSQDSPDWLEWRNKGIGSSDVALLMDSKPVFDRTIATLWKQKVGYEKPVKLDSIHIQRGKDLEPKIRDKVNELFGTKFEPVCVLREDAPYLRASLDGIDWDKDCLLEIKAPSEKVFKKYKDTWQIPDNYYYQMQYQMLCSNVDYGIFAFGQEVFDVDGNPDIEVFTILVKNNHEIQLDIERRCALFQKAVDTKIPIGWKGTELRLFPQNPTMFVIIGTPEQFDIIQSFKNLPLSIGTEKNKSCIFLTQEPTSLMEAKLSCPNHHIKIINLTESCFSNKVDSFITKKEFIELLKQTI